MQRITASRPVSAAQSLYPKTLLQHSNESIVRVSGHLLMKMLLNCYVQTVSFKIREAMIVNGYAVQTYGFFTG